MNGQKNNVITIDLGDLFRHLFKKWKAWLVCILLGGLLVAGYSYLSYQRQVQSGAYDAAMKDYQSQMDTYQENLDNYNDAISSYQSKSKRTTNPDKILEYQESINNATAARNSLTPPAQPEILSKVPTVNRLIKMFATGAVLGFILYAFCYILKYVLDGKIHNENDLSYRYNLLKLGRVNKNKKSKDQDAETYGLASVMIDNLNVSKEDIAVTGPLSQKSLDNQAVNLSKENEGYHLIPVSKVTEDPASFERVSSFKSAVLVIKADHSKMKDVDILVTYLNTAKIHILGYFVI